MTSKFLSALFLLFVFSLSAKDNQNLTVVTFQFKKKADRDLAARFSHLDVITKKTGKAVVNAHDLKVIKEKIPHLIISTQALEPKFSKVAPQ